MLSFNDAIIFLRSVAERTVPKELAKATGTIAQKMYNVYYRLSTMALDLARMFEIAKCVVEARALCYSGSGSRSCNICGHFWALESNTITSITRIKQSASTSFNGEKALFKVGEDLSMEITGDEYKLKYKGVNVVVTPRDLEALRKNLDQVLYALRGVEREVKVMKNALERCIKFKGISC